MMKKLKHKSKLRILAVIFISFFLLTCEKDKIKEGEAPCACGVENPQENIEWLKDKLKNSCAEVYLWELDGTEFLSITYYCMGTVDSGVRIYSCDGTIYCDNFPNGGVYCPEYFLKNAKKTLLYKQEN